MHSKKITDYIYGLLNGLSIRNKLILVYVICMVIPLILTDSIVFGLLEHYEKREEEYRMRSVADSVRYLVNSSFDEAVTAINKIYLDEDVYKFLDDDFESEYDFFEKRLKIIDSKIKPLDGGKESVLKMTKRLGAVVGINGGGFVDYGYGSDIPIGYVIKDGKIVYCAGHTGLYKVNLKTKKVKRIYIRKIRAPVKKEETAKPQQRIKG